MNLWGRLRKWALILTAPFFLMCEDPNEIGAELNPNNDNVNVVFRDFILPTSLILTDSIPTQGFREHQVGVMEDPIFGRIKSTAYLQLGSFDTGTQPQRVVDEEAVYDSIFISFRYSSFFGEDFSQTQRFEIYELADTLFPEVIYKSTFRTPIASTPVGVTEFQIDPDLDTLHITRLSDDYGSRLLDIVREETINGGSSILQNDIPGIALVPDDGNDYILGIQPTIQARDSIRLEESSAIRIYYHLPDNDTTAFYWDFTLDGRARYSAIDTDRSGSELSGLTTPFEEFIPVNDDRYIHPISGVHTKIDMSPIWDFIDTLNGFIVNKADLEINPIFDRTGPDDFISPLSEISLVFTSETNKIIGENTVAPTFDDVVLNDGSYSGVQNRLPLRIGYFGEGNLYRAEISNYLQAAADSLIDRTDLIIFPFRFASSATGVAANPVDQLTFNKDDLRIRLFYTTAQ